MIFRNTRTWSLTAFAKPFMVHRGVRVYSILHRGGWPLDYHYSWQQTRADGDRSLTGECFDIRKLPDFFERPGLLGMPAGATVRQWRDEHHNDRVEQIAWFIDQCMARGETPWEGFSKPLIPWRTFACAVAEDASELWRHWFPSAEEQAWRKDIDTTHPGSHLEITLMTDGTTHFRMIDGCHWKHNLDQAYSNQVPVEVMVRKYERHLRRCFKNLVPGDHQFFKSAHAVPNFCIHMSQPEFEAWATPYEAALGLPINAIVHGPHASVFRAAIDETSMQFVSSISEYIVIPFDDAKDTSTQN